MLVTAVAYLIIQVPTILYSGAAPDVQASGTAIWAFASLLVCLGFFFWYLYYQYNLSDELEEAKKEEALVKGISEGKITLIGVMYHELKNEFGADTDIVAQFPGGELPPEPAAEFSVISPVVNFFNIFRLFGSSSESTPLAAAGHNRYAATKSPSQSTMNRLRHILKPFFKKYDADNSGSLELGEVVSIFHDLGETATLKELESIFSKMDKDGSGSVDFDEFVIGVADYVLNSKSFKNKKSGLAAHDVEVANALEAKPETEGEEEEEEDVPEDLAELSPEEQQRQIKLRSFWMMGLGTLIVVLLSDPMVSVLNELGNRTGVPAFYVSFILAPLASNASEVIASYNYALKKTSQSIAISLSALEGACIMNNTFVMGIFMFIMYSKGLPWKYSAETLSILFVIVSIAALAQKKAHTVRDAFLILSLYPISLVLVAYLEYLGWE
jgi:Ca2+/Na+ antiporter